MNSYFCLSDRISIYKYSTSLNKIKLAVKSLEECENIFVAVDPMKEVPMNKFLCRIRI